MSISGGWRDRWGTKHTHARNIDNDDNNDNSNNNINNNKERERRHAGQEVRLNHDPPLTHGREMEAWSLAGEMHPFDISGSRADSESSLSVCVLV